MKRFVTLTKLGSGKCLNTLAYLVQIFILMSVYFDIFIMLFQIGPSACSILGIAESIPEGI